MKKGINRLAGKRTTYGITQQEMADMLGISLSGYNKKENGKCKFDIIEVNSILKFLQALDNSVTYDTIFFE